MEILYYATEYLLQAHLILIFFFFFFYAWFGLLFHYRLHIARDVHISIFFLQCSFTCRFFVKYYEFSLRTFSCKQTSCYNSFCNFQSVYRSSICLLVFMFLLHKWMLKNHSKTIFLSKEKDMLLLKNMFLFKSTLFNSYLLADFTCEIIYLFSVISHWIWEA